MTAQEPLFPGKKRVLLVDDHPIVRQGLAGVLNVQADLGVCGEASDAATAVAMAQSLAPDVAVVDLTLGDVDGLEVVKPLRRLRRSVPSVVFSMGDERRYAERALRAGARGYVMKSEPPATVLAAVRRVLGGAVFVSDAVASRLLSKIAGDRPAGDDDAADPVALLSQREYEVFRLIGQGSGPSAIAQQLGVSVKTIETYRENIKSKLKLPDGRALLRRAMERVSPGS